MAKPASLPRWATGGTAQVVEPTEGKKDVAWAPLEKPPAQYFNWLLKTIYLWCAYLDGLTNEALTWASKHTFSAGLSSDVAPVAYADVARKYEVDAEAGARAAADVAEAGARAAADALRPLDTAVVHNAGNETVAGIKTFSSSPVVPAPGAANQAANRGYVDGKFPPPTWSPITVNVSATPGAGEQAPAYWKDPCGVVHLRGFVTLTNGNNIVVTTNPLPAGSRPIANRDLIAANVTADKGVTFIVGGDGSMALMSSVAGTTLISLDGVSFVAEQ